MATYSVWQATTLGGSPLSLKAGTSIRVNREGDGVLVPLKADRLGAGSKSNPFTVASDGIARFYAAAGRYRVVATLAGHDPVEWKDVALGTAAEADIDLLTGNVTINGPITYDDIVADITERDAITTPVGVRVLVSDIGDGRSAFYELIDDSPQTWSDPIFIAGGVFSRIDVRNTTDAASNQVAIFEGDRATPAANDEIFVSFKLSDSAGNQDEFARITVRGTTVTSAAEAGLVAFSVRTGGARAEELFLTGAALSPAASGGLALGTAILPWASADFASGAVIRFDNTDTLTHSSGGLSWSGGALMVGGAPSTGIVNALRQSANTFSSGFFVYKRGTTGDANAAISSGSEMGYHSFYAWDGSAYGRGAFVYVYSSEAWNGSAHGTNYRIYVTPNGSTTAASGITITQDSSLEVHGTTAASAYTNGALIVRGGVGITGAVFAIDVWNSSTTATAVHVDSSGRLRKTASSRKYKENIADYDRGLADIMKVKPVFFTEKSNPGVMLAGMIAEDLHDAGLGEFVYYDEKQEPDAIHYPNMVALALSGIQELVAQNAALRDRIAQIESRCN